jgi:UDP-N-acetylmuramoylalanine--D-glutamate ligase
VTSLGDIAVLGLGKSGRAVAAYAARLVGEGSAASVTALDAADNDTLRAAVAQLEAAGVTVALGCEGVNARYDLCVASPGLPPHSALMSWADSACDKVVSEIEFAFEQSDVAWVAVTGTNGKTTTTALLAHLLKTGGIRAEAVGNIGFAATDALALVDPEVFVAEVSSFQLAFTEEFRPKVAILLNVTPDHADWHGSLEAYAAAKARVFDNMTASDLAVIDVDDSGSAPYAIAVAEKGIPVARVSLTELHEGGAALLGGRLVLRVAGETIDLISAEELQIRGAHNISNALAAARGAYALGVTQSDLRAGLRSFQPIAHRLEPVETTDGVAWFNDSKATNPDAVLKALHAFGTRPLIVLLGGRNKGNDFAALAREVCDTAKAAVLFGESRAELGAAFDGADIEVVQAAGLVDAVKVAASIASPGDVVALSPACASFDEFTSYEQRGDEFRRAVRALCGGEDR